MIKFALKNLRTRLTRGILACIAVILCTTIALITYNTAHQVEEGVISTAGYYDTIIGPEGSPLELVFSSMFFTESPLGTISYEYYEKVKENPSVTEAYPMAAGDNYQGIPIIGTVPGYLEDYEVQEGELFEATEEAVIGSNVADAGVLEIGDKFVGVHGFEENGHVHDEFEYEVVGILSESGTATDNVIFTTAESVWVIHDHDHDECGDDHDHNDHEHNDEHHDHDHNEHEHEHEDHDHEHNDHEHNDEHHDHDHNDHDQNDHEHDHNEHDHNEHDDHYHNDHDHNDHADEEGHEHDHDEHLHDHDHEEVTGELVSIILRTEGLAAHTELKSEFDEIAGVQAVNPTTVLRDLIDNLNLGRDVLFILAGIIVFMAAVVIYVTTASFVEDSKKDILIMRLLGIKRKTIFSLFVVQTVIISVVSIAISFIISYIGLHLINTFTADRMGILIDPSKHYPGEFLLVLGVFAIIVISAIISIIPVYKHDPLEVE